MATWQEVKSFIKSNYVISQESADVLALEFQIEDNRTQLIFVADFDSVDCVRFFSPFAKTSDISADQMIKIASTAVFGLAISGELVGAVHMVPTADLDASEINFPLALLSAYADGLEKSLGLGDKL
jgi:hypothetical protein